MHKNNHICERKQYMRAEKEAATHCSTLAWKRPWMEEPGMLQSMGLQRAGHNWATSHSTRAEYLYTSEINLLLLTTGCYNFKMLRVIIKKITKKYIQKNKKSSLQKTTTADPWITQELGMLTLYTVICI